MVAIRRPRKIISNDRFRVQINADVGVAYNIDGSALPGHA
jgi:hypothetical protein